MVDEKDPRAAWGGESCPWRTQEEFAGLGGGDQGRVGEC